MAGSGWPPPPSATCCPSLGCTSRSWDAEIWLEHNGPGNTASAIKVKQREHGYNKASLRADWRFTGAVELTEPKMLQLLCSISQQALQKSGEPSVDGAHLPRDGSAFYLAGLGCVASLPERSHQTTPCCQGRAEGLSENTSTALWAVANCQACIALAPGGAPLMHQDQCP